MWLSSPKALCAKLPHWKGLEEVWSILEEYWQGESVALEGVALEGVAKARRGARLESQRVDHKPSIMLRCFTGPLFSLTSPHDQRFSCELKVHSRQPYSDSAPLGSSWAPGQQKVQL